MEKMKVWMAWFSVQYEGDYGHEVFFKEEDGQKYLADHLAEYQKWGDYVDCVCVQVEVR